MFIVITFILFTALVAVIAAVKTREENLDTQDGYFLAGRSLTGPVIAGSLMLTNLSTEQLVGQAGQTYATNMGPMAWESTSCIALILLAFVFVPRYLKMGLTTIPEFLEQRYDSGLRKLITLLLLLGYLLTYLPTVLYSGALVFNQIFNISGLLQVSELQGVTITATAIGIVGAIYAIFGGLKAVDSFNITIGRTEIAGLIGPTGAGKTTILKAVAVSDTVNGIGLIIGGIALPVITVCAFGHGSFVDGIHNFINLIPAEKFNAINPANAQAPMIPWPVLFTGMVVNNLFYWATNQTIIQRALGAKNLAEAQKGAIYAAALKIITPLFIAICGLLVFYMAHNGLLSGDQVAALEKTSDLAYPTLIITMMPKPLLGFFAAVLFGAILSSFNSALNSCITLYTLDLHRPLFNPNASDAYLVRIGKRFGIVLAIISICIAPVVSLAPSGLYDFLQSCFGFFNVPILATVIIGMFTKYTPPIAPKAGLVLHVVLYSLTKTPLFPIHCHYLYVLFFLFVFQIAFQLIMGKVRPTAQPYVMKDAQVVDMAPWKHGKKAAIICIVLMLALYTLFSPIGLAG